MVPFYAALLVIAFLTAALALVWDTLPRRQWLVLAAYSASAAAELWFYFDTTVFGRRVDAAYLLGHYTVVLPFLGLTLGVYRGRLWYLVPGVAILWLAAHPMVPQDWQTGITGFLWYGTVYFLVFSWVTEWKPLGILFGVCLAVDGFFPWFQPVKDLFFEGFPVGFVPLVLAAGLALGKKYRSRNPWPVTETGPPPLSDGESADRFGLSPREREVARLVAEGKTNQQIADQLFISLPTVKKHVANLFAKTGVTNRTGLVRILGPSR